MKHFLSFKENSEVLSKEFDDYIAKPKPNGYQSLHTVVVGSQKVSHWKSRFVRAQCMSSPSLVWLLTGAIKEGSKRKAGENEEDRVAWLRQMLAWKSDVQQTPTPDKLKDEHIYVLTPQGRS